VELGGDSLAERISSVSDGDSNFSAFYHREFDIQIRRAGLLLDSSDEAHDVVQTACIAVYRRCGTLENPGGYLSRAVLNGCRDVGRRRASQRRLLPRLVDSSTVAGPEILLDDVLRSLPFNQRAVIVLRYYAGLTTEEIASQLGCAPGSVGPWIDRGLAKMRKAMK
jgi:DNA-directed RNA polymerase specialized sigma24 family protein